MRRFNLRSIIGRWADLDAKMQRCEEAKSFTEITEPILAPMEGEEAIVHERLVSVTSAGAGENHIATIQSYPSPEFLNSLPFIKKFYPAPRWDEGKVTKVAHENIRNSHHYEKPKSLSIVIPSDSEGIQPISNSTKLQGKEINSTETVHSPLTTHNSLKKAAFTLAEVLITLGIIGVVAALTLPTVIQNYQKQVTVNKLKKAYSVLGQVAQRAIADNGAISVTNGETLNSNTCKSIFYTYWLPYFKGAEVYPEGKKPNLNDNTAFYRHLRSGYWDTNIYTQYAAGRIFFTTPDDMSFYIDIMKWVSKYDNDGKLISQTGVYNSFQTVYVDINGLKQPNTIGKDVFIFTIDFEKGIAKPWGYNSSDSAINSNDVYYAAKIIKDGWKITYPW